MARTSTKDLIFSRIKGSLPCRYLGNSMQGGSWFSSPGDDPSAAAHRGSLSALLAPGHTLSPPRKKVTVKTPCFSFLASLLPGENVSVCSSYQNRMMRPGRRDKSPAAPGRTDFSMKWLKGKRRGCGPRQDSIQTTAAQQFRIVPFRIKSNNQITTIILYYIYWSIR